MKYADINTRFTAIAAEYMAKGYFINTATMCGSQGEIAHIDLTNGTEIIRILVNSFHEWANLALDGLEIIVGRADSKVTPNIEYSDTLWNSDLHTISTERFFVIGADRCHGKFYGTREEAAAAQQKRIQRYMAHQQGKGSQNITHKATEIAKRIVRREFGVKRICEADITVSKHNNTYTIGYKGKAYRLH